MSSEATESKPKPKVSSNQLALIRTSLANERTYLSFVRSGFAAIGLGLKLETVYPVMIGVGFVISGMYGYYKVKGVLRHAGTPLLTDNLILEVVVFAAMASLYWVLKQLKRK